MKSGDFSLASNNVIFYIHQFGGCSCIFRLLKEINAIQLKKCSKRTHEMHSL